MKVAKLIINNYSQFGISFGFKRNIQAELVFSTNMVGYPESLSDKSFHNQILVLTYPLIGNYGVPSDIFLESNHIQIAGLIIANYNDIPSHHSSMLSLKSWLKKYKIPALYNIDTRALTKYITEFGVSSAKMQIINSDFYDSIPPLLLNDIEEYNINGSLKILAIDCGMKNSQKIFLLKNDNIHLKIVNWKYNFINEKFDRLFISNGSGNPLDYDILINNLKIFLQNNINIPIFGICLGHQILALASGAQTYKMKYGNRGITIPVHLLNSNKAFMTSQNHGYAVDTSTLQNNWKELFVNLNDKSNEGIYHTKNPWLSVQFHPEGNAGPLDTSFLFDLFINNEFHKLLEINENKIEKIIGNKKILILGSGGLSIGQSGEFDYAGSQAIKAYREEGMTTILINPNIATVQTSPCSVDKTYFLPITLDYIIKIIKIERPHYISLSFGGQTALNCGIQLFNNNILQKYNIQVLGTNVENIIIAEDREKFKNIISLVNEEVCPSFIATSIDEALQNCDSLGFPLLVRSAFTLGGLGSGFVNNKNELINKLEKSFVNTNQVIIDKSFKGWKEIEYEIVRDKYDNCISVCNMENLNPLGIHTGDSIVVAPSQTLDNYDYYKLREVAFKVVRKLNIIGECNIQYALDPLSRKYYIIEVNPRLSRSSALASKATGYPLAYISAKIGLGYSLIELKNKITNTTAFCEPCLDYCVVKVPRWDLKKFVLVDTKLDSSMKSIGEAMAIGRTFEEALQKGLRMANVELDPHLIECNDELLLNPTSDLIYVIANGLYYDKSIDEIYEKTKIDKWFLNKIKNIIDFIKIIKLDKNLILHAKQLGFSDKQIGSYLSRTELNIRNFRLKNNISPFVKQIDTVAGEYPCFTNYLYLTYNAISDDILFNEKYIIVIGSGVYKIGSSVEFDWCCVQSVRELRKNNEKVIMINCNPETVSTDYDEVDKLYFEEISFEVVMDIYTKELTKGVILSMGGQLPNNIAMSLYRQNVKILGTSPEMIDKAENRFKFSRMLDDLHIDQPLWKELTSIDDAKKFCLNVQYPCLIRPSYVLSGVAMNVVYEEKHLEDYLNQAKAVNKEYPVVISKFIIDAKEIEVDAVAENGIVKLIAISEHIENAGVHSGDATFVLPAQDLTEETIIKIKNNVSKIANELQIDGPFNIQFIAKDNCIKVIECNLRVSRSFPFVSKTLDINFINIATNIMIKKEIIIPKYGNCQKIGVKIPQFSFNRLPNTDILLNVEMKSTGEVASFGNNIYEAYLKAIQSSGIRLPIKNIYLSIGSYKFKKEFIESVKILDKLGYNLCGSVETTDFYKELNINITEMKDYNFDFAINISRDIKYLSNTLTKGYYLRRYCIDHQIPILTNIKISKLFVNSLFYCITNNKINYITLETDCLTSYKTIRIPNLIDVHVHVRDFQQSYKEDWESCSKSALAGGITMIGAMPNTLPPIIDKNTLNMVKLVAKQKSYCDYGIYIGASPKNINEINDLECLGMKMYLNHTFGDLLLENMEDWISHLKNWTNGKVICVHAETYKLASIIHLAHIYERKIHICHISKKCELEIIIESKLKGYNISCEVSPHHLFLNNSFNNDFSMVCPSLQSEDDRLFLWKHLEFIDCFATDHAPHTIEDKLKDKCVGYPELETVLPLLLTAVHNGLLTIDDIILKYHTNPLKIFNLKEQENTYIEVDIDKEWIIPNKMKYSKAGWTPYNGMKVYGMIKRVILRGKVVYSDGDVIGNAGYGINMISEKNVEKIIKYDLDVIVEKKKENIKLGSILSVEQFDRKMLKEIFKKTNEMRQIVLEKGCVNYLHNKVLANIFYEPSTRTRCSFSVAMQRLGGKVIDISSDISSVQKGESLDDFIRTMESYSDIIVLRCKEKIKYNGKKILINAGDGVGEHPTQALLDIYTIREERGTVNGLIITIVGDLKHGRTVHSLAKMLSLYNVKINYVSPIGLEIPTEIKEYIGTKIEQKEYNKLEDVIEETDVLYMTRLQRERFNGENIEYYKITSETIMKSKENMIIMHPFPRVDEISIEIDNDPRAVYFRQMENGLYVRMAILSMLSQS